MSGHYRLSKPPALVRAEDVPATNSADRDPADADGLGASVLAPLDLGAI